MQTSYSKQWLSYLILLKIGKGERSQLTFTALPRRAGEPRGCWNVVTALWPARQQPSARGLPLWAAEPTAGALVSR